MNRILIVEDDKGISDAVALNMQFVGYESHIRMTQMRNTR